MRTTVKRLNKFLQIVLRQEEGQDLVEYALVLGLLTLAAVGGLNSVAGPVNSLISKVTSSLNSA